MYIALIFVAFGGLVVPENNNRMRVFVANLEEYAGSMLTRLKSMLTKLLWSLSTATLLRLSLAPLRLSMQLCRSCKSTLMASRQTSRHWTSQRVLSFVFIHWPNQIFSSPTGKFDWQNLRSSYDISIAVAFHAVLDSHNPIPVGTTVKFNTVKQSKGNGWVTHAEGLWERVVLQSLKSQCLQIQCDFR